jgi:putative heme-binding domain-containing protein
MLKLAASDFPFQDNVKWWLNNRRSSLWKPFGLTKTMKQRGLLKDVPLVMMVTPPVPEGAPAAPTVEEVMALTGNPQHGEAAAAVCLACHKIGKQGVDFGPDLTSFGKQQPREVIVGAIVTPSKEISHGFEGSRIETKDGLIIDGIVIATGDPTVVKCMGGQKQEIDEDKIKSVTPMERSLMYDPQTLGLNAQTVADVVEYLKAGKFK